MIQIIGKGGFGRELAAYLASANIPYFAYENECAGISGDIGTVIAIGDEDVREEVVEKFDDRLAWTTCNLGKSYGNCHIGTGTIIVPSVILTTDVVIGKHCLINLLCTIGHDVFIGDFVTINPGVNISGGVRIGNSVNIGSNAVIRDKITVCDNVTIGAGSVVVKDITESGVYVGNPAKKIKD